jgi:exodeoxyribonuclease V alpha subunit
MAAEPPATLHGVLERIVFFNDENHFTIAEFRPGDGGPKVTITGPLPGVQCGETLALAGQWTRHPQHGDQFKIESFRSELPSTVYGIRKYLGSGLVHGIGKVYAKKIVDRFGTDTLRVISDESALLRSVDGIGPQRAAAIKKAWDEQRALREVLVFLQTYGATVGQCLRLVKRYGSAAKQVLVQEPYRVAREIEGIGFRTADKIALNLGFATDSPARLDAGLLFALETLADDGHTACPGAELRAVAAELLQNDPGRIGTRIDALVASRALVRHGGGAQGLVQDPEYDRAEDRIAASLRRLVRTRSGLPPIKIDAALRWAQEKSGVVYSERQIDALQRALASKVSVLTGGPGTGKTTVLRALVAILKAKKCRVHLAAPTGRAAQRIAETTGGFAQTIHRLLQFDPAKGGFAHDASSPLKTDFLVVDEASMLDTRLAAALLSAVPASAHLLLVGDVDQLPSVGAGNVLGDIIASGAAPVTRLDVIYRQQHQSLVVSIAHAVNHGDTRLPPAAQGVSELPLHHDLVFVPVASAEECLARVVELCARVLPARMPEFDPVTDVQVLAPMHKGVAGVANLNRELQAALNPHGRSLRAPAGDLRAGDKILQLRNNYDKGLFNGDIGVVVSVAPDDGTLVAAFDGERHVLDRGDLGDVALAYACSIHKSQGSEYPVVVVPLLKGHFVMLQRNLLYTAITRGRKRVFVVGEPAAWAMAVRNNDDRRRCTFLAERIRAGA